jgi:hypothetical protein
MDTSMLAFRVMGDQRAVSALKACAAQRNRLAQSCIGDDEFLIGARAASPADENPGMRRSDVSTDGAAALAFGQRT